MLIIWRITMRNLAYAPGERSMHSKLFALKSRSEVDAVRFAKANIFTPEWWDGYIITAIEPLSELWAAEGFDVPMEED